MLLDDYLNIWRTFLSAGVYLVTLFGMEAVKIAMYLKWQPIAKKERTFSLFFSQLKAILKMEGFYLGARKIKTEYIKQGNNFLERKEEIPSSRIWTSDLRMTS